MGLLGRGISTKERALVKETIAGVEDLLTHENVMDSLSRIREQKSSSSLQSSSSLNHHSSHDHHSSHNPTSRHGTVFTLVSSSSKKRGMIGRKKKGSSMILIGSPTVYASVKGITKGSSTRQPQVWVKQSARPHKTASPSSRGRSASPIQPSRYRLPTTVSRSLSSDHQQIPPHTTTKRAESAAVPAPKSKPSMDDRLRKQQLEVFRQLQTQSPTTRRRPRGRQLVREPSLSSSSDSLEGDSSTGGSASSWSLSIERNNHHNSNKERPNMLQQAAETIAALVVTVATEIDLTMHDLELCKTDNAHRLPTKAPPSNARPKETKMVEDRDASLLSSALSGEGEMEMSENNNEDSATEEEHSSSSTDNDLTNDEGFSTEEEHYSSTEDDIVNEVHNDNGDDEYYQFPRPQQQEAIVLPVAVRRKQVERKNRRNVAIKATQEDKTPTKSSAFRKVTKSTKHTPVASSSDRQSQLVIMHHPSRQQQRQSQHLHEQEKQEQPRRFHNAYHHHPPTVQRGSSGNLMEDWLVVFGMNKDDKLFPILGSCNWAPLFASADDEDCEANTRARPSITTMEEIREQTRLVELKEAQDITTATLPTKSTTASTQKDTSPSQEKQQHQEQSWFMIGMDHFLSYFLSGGAPESNPASADATGGPPLLEGRTSDDARSLEFFLRNDDLSSENEDRNDDETGGNSIPNRRIFPSERDDDNEVREAVVLDETTLRDGPSPPPPPPPRSVAYEPPQDAKLPEERSCQVTFSPRVNVRPHMPSMPPSFGSKQRRKRQAKEEKRQKRKNNNTSSILQSIFGGNRMLSSKNAEDFSLTASNKNSNLTPTTTTTTTTTATTPLVSSSNTSNSATPPSVFDATTRARPPTPPLASSKSTFNRRKPITTMTMTTDSISTQLRLESPVVMRPPSLSVRPPSSTAE